MCQHGGRFWRVQRRLTAPMSKRVWVGAIALGLVAFGALAQEAVRPERAGPSTPAAEQQQIGEVAKTSAPQDPAASDRLISTLQRIESAVRDLVSEEDRKERQADQRRGNADLYAQLQMARWAFWVAVAAGASVFLIAVGLVFIGRTMRYLRIAAEYAGKTLDEAKRASKAAEDAVAETRRIGEAQTKAYLTAKNVTFDFYPQTGGPPVARLSFTCHNTGNSPARNVAIRLIMQVFATNHASSKPTDDLGFSYSTKSSSSHPIPDLGAQTEETRVILFSDLSADALAEFDGTKYVTIGVWIQLSFVDVFERDDVATLPFKLVVETPIRLEAKYRLKSSASVADRSESGI